MALRSAGFATFSITWKELDAYPNGWIQILPPLNDPAVTAWLIVGKPEDFTDSIRSKVALLTLAMERHMPPATAFVLQGEGDIQDVPYAMNHIQIYRYTQKFAVKLMVAKVKPQPFTPLPFRVKAHLDPFIGAWLEVAPQDNETWAGFMVGVTQAKITSFGVGPRGLIPTKSTLQYPLLGIEGSLGKLPFHACAAKNELSSVNSCYIRLDGTPGLLLCLEYPEEGEKPGRSPVQLELI
jgi:hypothetical protein